MWKSRNSFESRRKYLSKMVEMNDFEFPFALRAFFDEKGVHYVAQ